MDRIKPSFVFGLSWVRVFFIVFDIWFFIFMMSYIICAKSLELEIEDFGIIIGHIFSDAGYILIHALWIGLSISIVIPLVFIRPYYKGSTFIFEGDHFIYKHKFITTVHRETDFKNVKEVVLKQGPFQRLFGVGTIHLLTHATPYQSGMTSGLKLFDLKNPHEVQQKIKELIS
ncbi:MAG: PH domain-containing protein [bacterium]|nr:PH domain-containing protein [bacterium]